MIDRLKRWSFILLMTALLLSLPHSSGAQCAMCKSNIEKARESGETKVGSTLNTGILYLLVLPYSIAMVFGIIYYRNYQQKKKVNHV